MEREPQFVAQSPVEKLALRANEILPRRLVMAGIDAAVCGYRGIVAAATDPLFFDEILTLAVSSQSIVSGIWTASAGRWMDSRRCSTSLNEPSPAF
jgi:hypothetical protein